MAQDTEDLARIMNSGSYDMKASKEHEDERAARLAIEAQAATHEQWRHWVVLLVMIGGISGVGWLTGHLCLHGETPDERKIAFGALVTLGSSILSFIIGKQAGRAG